MPNSISNDIAGYVLLAQNRHPAISGKTKIVQMPELVRELAVPCGAGTKLITIEQIGYQTGTELLPGSIDWFYVGYDDEADTVYIYTEES